MRSGFEDRRAVYELEGRPYTREVDGKWDRYFNNWGLNFPEYDERFDYHFWYQTNTGHWAEKNASLPSRKIPDVLNPSNDSWWPGFTQKSSVRYYKVDCNTI